MKATTEEHLTAATATDDGDETTTDEQTSLTPPELGQGTPTRPDTWQKPRGQIRWTRICAYGLLPGLVFALAGGAGYLKWTDSSIRQSQLAGAETVQVATDSAIAMLSYRPDSADKDLGAARERLTGQFKDSYTALTDDVVIPGAKQKQVTALATVPAAASVSANPSHATVLVLVDQTITVGAGVPTSTASSVKVTLDKAGDRWLISGFDPV